MLITVIPDFFIEMGKERIQKIVVVGVGNTIRRDDGIGAYICSCIDDLKLPGVQTIVTQQLHTEMLGDLMSFDFIVLADAATTGEEVEFFRLKGNDTQPVSTSHHISAGMLALLAQRLYKRELSIMICAVRGEDFDIGDQISETAKRNALCAVETIRDWIVKGCS